MDELTTDGASERQMQMLAQLAAARAARTGSSSPSMVPTTPTPSDLAGLQAENAHLRRCLGVLEGVVDGLLDMLPEGTRALGAVPAQPGPATVS